MKRSGTLEILCFKHAIVIMSPSLAKVERERTEGVGQRAAKHRAGRSSYRWSEAVATCVSSYESNKYRMH